MADLRVHELLKQLDQELDDLPCPSEEQTRLCRLRDDVGRFLDQPGQKRLEGGDLLEQLRRTRDLFELSHPRIALLIERISDALNDMGI